MVRLSNKMIKTTKEGEIKASDKQQQGDKNDKSTLFYSDLIFLDDWEVVKGKEDILQRRWRKIKITYLFIANMIIKTFSNCKSSSVFVTMT